MIFETLHKNKLPYAVVVGTTRLLSTSDVSIKNYCIIGSQKKTCRVLELNERSGAWIGKQYLCTPDDLFLTDDYDFVLRIDKWHPNTDWNQLMMVVEKIREEDNVEEINITSNYCSIWLIRPIDFEEGEEYPGIHRDGDITIEAVYNACVEYIKSKT